MSTIEDLDAFRARCRDFLAEHASPLHLDGPDPRDDQTVAHSAAFLKKLADAGLAGLTYGTEYGGAGMTKAEERAWREEYAHFPDCSGAFTISHGMCLPMMNEFGSEEQKKQFMPRMINGEDMWCQMFSEPGAGSDVASLQTKAVKDGDQWIINGQKVWTTLAHHSNYGILVARTDPELVKHAGISMFIVDMRDPAIEIRAIHQIDGGMHFNEIFFTDLAIPADWILGEYNAGWKQATAMLMYERVAHPQLQSPQARGHQARHDPGSNRARQDDEDLQPRGDQVARVDAHPRRDEGGQGSRSWRLAWQAPRFEHRLDDPRVLARDGRPAGDGL